LLQHYLERCQLLSITFLKVAAPAIAPSLTNIYNTSIDQGIFPNNFKKARITAIHKKDSIHVRDNYRPISVLPIISKPLEKHVSTALQDFLNSHNLLYKKQSAYRKYHSCETALLHITDKWLMAMDKDELIGTLFLDLSKAFDLIDHDILISKLKSYHIADNTLNWFQSYVCERSQKCAFLGSLSESMDLTHGVPQGSILGPLLFTLYTNDLPLSVNNTIVNRGEHDNTNLELYADDTTIWHSGNSLNSIY
jgi:hypothetical protein